MFVAKYAPDGSYLWARRLKSGSTLNYGCSASFDATGNLVTGGYFAGSVDFGGGVLSAGVSAQSGYVVKYGP
jgi:hypothetical protein